MLFDYTTRNTDIFEYTFTILYTNIIIIVLECTDECAAVERVSTVDSSTALKIKVLHHGDLYRRRASLKKKIVKKYVPRALMKYGCDECLSINVHTHYKCVR